MLKFYKEEEVKKFRLKLVLVVLIFALLGNLVSLPSHAFGQSNEFSISESGFLSGKQSEPELTAITECPTNPQIDIVFAIDLTGSMTDEIAVVKSRAVEIINTIRSKIPDTHFGLVSFMDYPGYFTYPGYSATYGDASYGDVPYRVNVQPTGDINSVITAINGLKLGYGEDWPQDYTRVLYESMFLNWRPSANKILIMFGDAPTHDLNFANYNFGGDPGRDGIAQTTDDLDFEDVVRQVKEKGITVFAVDSGGTPQSEATFKGMSIKYAEAEGTNGQYFLLQNASQIPQAIEDMFNELLAANTPILLVHGFQASPTGFDPLKIWISMAMELAGHTNYRTEISLAKNPLIGPLIWPAFTVLLSVRGILVHLYDTDVNFWVIKRVDCFHPDVYISNYALYDSIPTLLSISTYSRKLKSEIDYIKNVEGATKVNIVAHSMGGLVSRRYIESVDFGEPMLYAKDIGKLIMIGTPNHGTFLANTFAKMFPLSQCALEMATNSPFLDRLNKEVNSKTPGINVEYTTFAGEIQISNHIITSPEPKDGVVTCLSVALDDAENYKVEYADHSGLINDGGVFKAVKDVIIGKTISGPIKTEAPYVEDLTKPLIGGINLIKLLLLEFNCPVNVTIKDQYGRIINNQGVNQIPDASVDVIGEEKTFALPTDLAYTIYVEAYSSGSFSLDGLFFNGSTTIPAIAFENIAISSSTKVESSVIQPNSIDFLLNVDSDGNGSIDYQKLPDILGEILRVPSAPQDLQASTNTTSITLNWTASIPGTYPIAGYAIYRGRVECGESPVPFATVPSNTTTYTDTQITVGETYYYYVKAFDNQSTPNYSDPSNEASVNTGTHTITASAGPGGSISPSGAVSVNYGKSQSFTIKADPGYFIYRILVDGTSIQFNNPMVYTYTFNNVIANHTIRAEFMKIPDTTPPNLTLPKINGVNLDVPGAEITTNSGTFTFTVSATDESGIGRMVVKVNGVVQIDKNNLDPTIYLSEGVNTVEVTVYDTVGNYTTKSFKVISDTKPPVIDVDDIPNTVSSPEFTLKGTAIDLVIGVQSLTVNGNPVIPTLQGNFETTLTLSQGANTITIEATDKLGNKATKTFTVSYIQPQVRPSYLVTLKINDPNITVNGILEKIDAQGSKPIIQNGRTLLPIRTLIESLGGTVEWNAKEQKVTITLNGHSMVLTIGRTTALVDGNKVSLDVAPTIINGRTYLPLRFISENLGASVNWDSTTQTVTIYYWPQDIGTQNCEQYQRAGITLPSGTNRHKGEK